MSNVTLIIVWEDNIHSVTAHWREIKALLEKKPQPIAGSPNAEYIVLDLNKKLLVNAQGTFAIDKMDDFAVQNI